MHLAHDRYYAYEEFTANLHALAQAHANLARLESVGQSHHNREIWAFTLTNFDSGRPENKPGFYIDANNHGEEIITSAVGLYTIDYILSNHGRDPLVTELLDTRVIYILPRVNPDGVEICMSTPYRTVGNGHYLPWEEHTTGLHLEDVNEDGKILQMRIPDPRGEWKVSELEPRLLTLRQP
ncbi:MAG: M14 family zinc carboxypeptidase, partial [Anaerolineae bacterium]|nr:M14 family zinc carboxypeptidase [Anaerolineae bacterium]